MRRERKKERELLGFALTRESMTILLSRIEARTFVLIQERLACLNKRLPLSHVPLTSSSLGYLYLDATSYK